MSKSVESQECFPLLPFSLQDLCLLEVINDLDSYPVELLASLPRWLRYRLLNNLPALDLCHMGRTPIARGVDVENIWKSRVIQPKFYDDSSRWDRNLVNPFQVGYCTNQDKKTEYILKPSEIPNLDPELDELFQGILTAIVPDSGISPGRAVVMHDHARMVSDTGDKSLVNVALGILNRVDPVYDDWNKLDAKQYPTMLEYLHLVADKLIALNGELMMTNLTGMAGDVSPQDKQVEDESFKRSYRLWNTQVTTLAKYENWKGEIQHAPCRLLPIRERGDPLELFSLITRDCGLRPTKLLMDYSKLGVYVKKRKLDEEKFASVLKYALQDIVHLGLWRADAGLDINMCRTVIEGVVGDGKRCQLKVLYCRKLNDDAAIKECLRPSLLTLSSDQEPPRYRGLTAVQFSGLDFGSIPYVNALLQQHLSLKVVHIDQVLTWATIMLPTEHISPSVKQLFKTLGSLFWRPQFQVLKFSVHHTMVGTGQPRMLNDLLKGFMLAPCSHVQQLTLDHEVEYKFKIHDIEDSEVASFKLEGTVAECGLQHKRLISKTQHIRLQLLWLPTIRLRELTIDCGIGRQVHLTAIHPDLQVNKLVIILDKDSLKKTLPDTLCEDLKALLKLSKLRELYVKGHWGGHEDAMTALTQGFSEQAKVGCLRKISLCITQYTVRPHNQGRLEKLWIALFTLPQLNNLEFVVYGDEFLEISKTIEKIIYEGWEQSAAGRKVKVLEYVTCAPRKFEHFDKVAQEFIQTRPVGFGVF